MSVVKRLKKLGPAGNLRCCYEAGPTGLGLLPRAEGRQDRVRGRGAIIDSEEEWRPRQDGSP